MSPAAHSSRAGLRALTVRPVVWPAADLRDLKAGRVEAGEVVYAFVSVAGGPCGGHEACLDDEERGRAARFVHRSDHSRFVLAHAALRWFLARHLGMDPTAVTYERGMNGKPHLGPDPTVEFNLSHSGDLALIAVARDRSVGVDVERIRDLPEAMSIAETHFATAERRALGSLPPAERRDAFFRCWTRKEAVIKAVGDGLSRALDSFAVDLAPGATAELRSFAGRPGEAAGLSLRDLPAPPGYTAAGAVAVNGLAPTRWRCLQIERCATNDEQPA